MKLLKLINPFFSSMSNIENENNNYLLPDLPLYMRHMTCAFADGGVRDSYAFYREQEHDPARPWLPDSPTGVVWLWLPALVSNIHTF